jgi:hypothetical protein
MSEPEKKPSVAFWSTVVSLTLVVYVLSYGPACWVINAMANRSWLRPDTEWIRQAIFLFFFPIRFLLSDGPKPISDLIFWFQHLWY